MVYTYGSAFSSAATVKITAFGNVMTRVAVRFCRCSPAFILNIEQSGFAAVKCLVSPTLHYVSINLLFTSHFNALYLSLFD